MAGVQKLPVLPQRMTDALLTPEESDAAVHEAWDAMGTDEVKQTLIALVHRSVYPAYYPWTDPVMRLRHSQRQLAHAVRAAPDADEWGDDELLALLAPVADPYHLSVAAAERVAQVVESQPPGRLAAFEQPLTEFYGAVQGHAATAIVAGTLARLLPPPVPMDAVVAAIQLNDHWGCRSRIALRRLDDLSLAAMAELLEICAVAGTGKHRPKWTQRFDRLAAQHSVAAALSALVEPLTTLVDDQTGYGHFQYRSQNEVHAAGACALLGRLARSAGTAEQTAAVALLERTAFWGAKWEGNRPASGPVARGAIMGLCELGSDGAVVAMHHLQERFGTRPGLKKPIVAAMDELLAARDRTLVQILAGSDLTLGLDAGGARRWPTSLGEIEVRVAGSDTVITGTELVDPDVSADQAALDAAQAAATTIASELAVITRRLDSYLRDRRTFSMAEFAELVHLNPLNAAIAGRLIWEFRIDDLWRSGAPDGPCHAIGVDGPFSNADATDARLWHPAAASAADVAHWRAWVMRERVVQPVRQAHREVFAMPAPFDTIALLRTSKVDAVLRARGWKLQGLGGWDGGDTVPAVRTDGPTGWTITATVDTVGADASAGRYEMGWCTIDTPEISVGTLHDDDEQHRIFASEALRDLALAHAAGQPSGRDAAKTASPFHGVWLAGAHAPLSGPGLLRHEVLQQLIGDELSAEEYSLSDRHLLVRRKSGTYRIHLGSAIVLHPDGSAKAASARGRDGLPWLPFEADGTLGAIVRTALTLR